MKRQILKAALLAGAITLADPQHVSNGELMRFDRVIANMPFSLKNWGTISIRGSGFSRACRRWAMTLLS